MGKSLILSIFVAFLFFSSYSNVKAADVITPSTNAVFFQEGGGGQSVINTSYAYDDNVNTGASVSSNGTDGLVSGYWQFDYDLPENAEITQINFVMYTQAGFSAPGCSIFYGIYDPAFSTGREVTSYSTSDDGLVNITTFSLSDSVNSDNFADYNYKSGSNFKVGKGTGTGTCVTPMTRDYNETYITISYNIPDGNLLTQIYDAMVNVYNAIVALPDQILDILEYFFLPDPDFVSLQFNELQETALGRIPFGYADAVFDIDTSEIASPSTTLNLQIPFYKDTTTGDPVYVGATFDGNTDPVLSIVRNFFKFVLWFGFLSYIVYRVRGVL